MSAIDYIVPLVYTSEDNESYVNTQRVFIKNCNVFRSLPSGFLADECDGFNFNLCGNDEVYNQPFVKGDIIYFQNIIDFSQYYNLSVEIINSETGENFIEELGAEPDKTEFQFMTDANNNTYANLKIDTSAVAFQNVNCWYFKFIFYKCDLNDTPELLDCIAEKQSEDPERQLPFIIMECYKELCNDFDQRITEPYQVIRCDDPSLLIEGSYKDYDCDNFFYGEFDDVQSIYKLSFRIFGNIEPNGFDIEETLNNDRKVKSQRKERFVLYSRKIPYYVAQQVGRAFDSQILTINDIEYKGAIKVDKNFEDGRMWILKEDIFTKCNEINYGCD